VTREEAIESLTSPSAVTRLQAARALYDSAQVSDIPLLQRALTAEADAYVQHALARLCLKLSDATGDAAEGDEDRLISDALIDEVRANVVEEITQIIRHEISKTVGLLELHAVTDFGRSAYNRSELIKDVHRLQEFLDVLGRLNTASGTPKYEEADIGDLIMRASASVTLPDEVTLIFATTDSVIARADAGFLGLALENVLRNAAEACAESRGTIVISWGVTDRDIWIAVHDDGSGLELGYDQAQSPGTSTKEGHFGWGLFIVKRALASMGGGTLELRPASKRGAIAELRWPHPMPTHDENPAD
jgi:signal transduction histidine kinase